MCNPPPEKLKRFKVFRTSLGRIELKASSNKACCDEISIFVIFSVNQEIQNYFGAKS
tara:strand:+ start:267 stop:437 length:171 start_codon:yes stop_codon:yes gene_type:complete